ncbi:hypothetical protein LXA43DRAFT_1093301 [Ganoderma leucocontextum]|nr:hypothetical protein LXA43DRAFT_1093301 [Ganoderma leucocontextum]
MGRYKVYIPGNYGRHSPDHPTDPSLTAADYYPWYFWSGHILSIALSPRSKAILEEQGHAVTFKARNMSQWSLLLSQCNTTLKIDFRPVPTEVPFVKITTLPSSDFSPDDRCEALAGVLEWQVSRETPSFMTFPRLVLTTSAGAELYLQLLLENYKPSFGYAQMLYVNMRPSQGPRAANLPFTDSRVLHGYRPLPDGFEPLGTTEPEDWPTGKWRRRRVAAVPTTEEADQLARPNEPHDFRWFVRGIFELISTFHVV